MGLMRNHHNEHYPAWLEENWLFRKLFVLRMLLRRKPRQHHGLPSERQFLKNNFPKNHRGFYVDVGCYHPVKDNNTWLMYKKGWSGINIDLEEIKIDAFKLRRPRDINIHMAVSNQPGELRYFSRGIWSGATGAALDNPASTNIWHGGAGGSGGGAAPGHREDGASGHTDQHHRRHEVPQPAD